MQTRPLPETPDAPLPRRGGDPLLDGGPTGNMIHSTVPPGG